MDQETPNPLPFSETAHTTLADVTETRQILADLLLPELARPITSVSYNPWITKRRDDRQEYEAELIGGNLNDYSIAALYLFTEPLPTELKMVTEPRPTELKMVTPKRIIFQTQAKDQGWATFGGEAHWVNKVAAATIEIEYDFL
ncbi:hypothetical protein N0V84_002176 [Fusarium piperis]|uniref:Uncharacterized protein n=1 Tax=Fusarium piperis TaxID=1435070 RepID=A0A9W8WJQ6_9HYPO|nr:hypothetical protein N0V84_002176 [Fusarium piperis]